MDKGAEHKETGLTPGKRNLLTLARSAQEAVRKRRKGDTSLQRVEDQETTKRQNLEIELKNMVINPDYLDGHNVPLIPEETVGLTKQGVGIEFPAQSAWEQELETTQTVVRDLLRERMQYLHKKGKVEKSSTPNGYFLSSNNPLQGNTIELRNKESMDIVTERSGFFSRAKHKLYAYRRSLEIGEKFGRYATFSIGIRGNSINELSLLTSDDQGDIQVVVKDLINEKHIEDMLSEGIDEIYVFTTNKDPRMVLKRGNHIFTFSLHGDTFTFNSGLSTHRDNKFGNIEYSITEVGGICQGLAQMISRS